MNLGSEHPLRQEASMQPTSKCSTSLWEKTIKPYRIRPKSRLFLLRRRPAWPWHVSSSYPATGPPQPSLTNILFIPSLGVHTITRLHEITAKCKYRGLSVGNCLAWGNLHYCGFCGCYSNSTQ